MATDDLIRLEQVLLQSLDYNFMVFHPYRATGAGRGRPPAQVRKF